MLVIFQNFEQRFFFLTLPKVTPRTPQEFLKIVNVPYSADNNIQWIHNPGISNPDGEIHCIVTINSVADEYSGEVNNATLEEFEEILAEVVPNNDELSDSDGENKTVHLSDNNATLLEEILAEVVPNNDALSDSDGENNRIVVS
jgi:hypothetical protein